MLDIFSKAGRDEDFGNPTHGRGFQKLRNSMRWSFKKLETFRTTRKKLIDTYTGGSYADGGESGSVPVNLLELAVSIYQRQLASHTPQVSISSKSFSLQPVARELELAVNHVIDKRLDLGSVLNEWVIDAMFAMGIIKVGEVNPGYHNPRGFRSKGLYVYADTVGLEDWCHDMTARKYEEAEYAGHMYDASVEEVMENKEFNKAARDLLWASKQKDRYTIDYSNATSERPEELSGGDSWMPDDYVDKVVLWEMWVPRDNIIMTFSANNDDQPLLEREWEGPDHGPYHLLGFSPVPGNVMPVSPAMLWEDLMDLVNRMFLKIADQADRQRTILVGQNRAANDMQKMTRTADGETLLTDVDPQLMREFSFGGVNGPLMATFMQFKDMFSYTAGNIDTLGGLSSVTDTVGQDKMIKSSASERLSDYQQRVVKATTKVVRDIAWYLWNNDDVELPLTKPITSTISRDFKWTKFSKEGDIFDYNIDTVPHSLQYKSPQEKLQTMTMVVNQTILPMMEMMMSQGITFDLFKYLEHVAKLSNVQEINDLVRNMEGKQMNQRDVIDSAKSPVTHRSYTRQSLPSSATSEGKQQQAVDQFQQMAQSMAGGQGGMRSTPGRPPAGAVR